MVLSAWFDKCKLRGGASLMARISVNG